MCEWNEKNIGGFRGLRGGSWASSLRELQSSGNFIGIPPQEKQLHRFSSRRSPEPLRASLSARCNTGLRTPCLKC